MSEKRLKDVNLNSRGLLSPRYLMSAQEMASAKTRIGGEGCRSASFRRHFLSCQFFHGFKTRGYSPFGLPVIDFVQIAQAWHISSKLGSALAQSQFSRRLRVVSFERLLNLCCHKTHNSSLISHISLLTIIWLC